MTKAKQPSDFDVARESLLKWADEVIAEREAEAEWRISYNVHRQWWSHYYLRQGYLIEPATRGSRHFSGSDEKLPQCPGCGQKLTLLLDVDCTAPCFRKEEAPVFQGLARLPLYYCFVCAGSTTYRVMKNRVQLIPSECDKGDEPLQASHQPRRRQAIRLRRIEDTQADQLALAQHITPEWLTSRQKKQLMEYVGNHPTAFFNLARSQFGGLPYFFQGYRDYECRNSRCKTHLMGSPFCSHGVKYRMKALASIGHKLHAIPDGEEFLVIFQICWYCSTVTAELDCT